MIEKDRLSGVSKKLPQAPMGDRARRDWDRRSKRVLEVTFDQWVAASRAGGERHLYSIEKRDWIRGAMWKRREYLPPMSKVVQGLRVFDPRGQYGRLLDDDGAPIVDAEEIGRAHF